MPTLQPLDGNPIRLGALAFLVMLVGPGSLAGVTLLAAQGGVTVPLPAVSSAAHGMTLVTGAFLVLIWCFLTHALPGMLGARDALVLRIREPALALALCTALAWGADAWGDAALRGLARWAVAAVATAGTGLLGYAILTAERPWRVVPYPFLLLGLGLLPVSAASWALALGGVVAERAAAETGLYLVLVPIILSMAFRMVSALLGSLSPHKVLFTAAMLTWIAGSVLRVLDPASTSLALPARLFQAVGAVGALAALRVFRVRRGLLAHVPADLRFRALQAHVVTGVVSLAAGPLLEALGMALPALQWAAVDLGRHLVSMGFCLLITMGITQRVLPQFVRGVPSSGAWMWLNWSLVTGSLLLRAAPLVDVRAHVLLPYSALMAWVGILSYAVHLTRGLLWRSPHADAAAIPNLS